MFTHIDKDGNAKMVDVSKKDNSDRIAIASGLIELNNATIRLL
jgi:cyclic pyranopterin phosphate synthase